MKLTAVFGLILFFYSSLVQCQEGLNGDAYELVVGTESDLPLVLDHFGRKYAIDFAYSPEVLAGTMIPGGFVSGGTLEEVLAALLAPTSLTYRVVADNRVLIRQKEAGIGEERSRDLTLTGQLVDAADHLPVSYVAVCLDTLNLATQTDESGWFSLSIPVGWSDRKLLISRLGYRDTSIQAGAFQYQSELALQVDALLLTEVTVMDFLPVIGLRSLTSAGGTNLSQAAPIHASQVSGNDLFRTVQLLSGVAATDDLSAGLKIRGSNTDETLIILDGIPIYQADHFYGIFSAVNSAYVEEVTLYKNAWPIEYSGRTAGMLLMESSSEINAFDAKVEANLLYSALQVSAPLSRDWSFSLAGRTSLGNVASSKFFDWVGSDPDLSVGTGNPDFSRSRLIRTTPDFNFNDLNGKLLFRPNDHQQLSVNFFRSRDNFSNTYENTFRTRERIVQVVNFEDYKNEEDWGNTGLSFNYTNQLTPGWTLQANAYYSAYRRAGLVRSSLSQVRQGESRTFAFENQQDNQVRDWGGRVLVSNQEEQKRGLRVGLGFSRRDNVYELRTDESTLLSGAPQSTEGTLFGEYRWALRPDWYLMLGARLHYYGGSRQLYGAPSVKTRFEVAPDLVLKGAFSIHYQFVREITHETRLGQSLDFLLLSDGGDYPVGKAVNYMAGAIFKRGNWSVDLEVFHKDMDEVLEHASLFPGFLRSETRPSTRTDYQLFKGDGRISGVDVELGYDRGRYSGWIAYTLSKLTHRFPRVRNNEPFPAQDDRRHQLKWINSLQLGRFDFSANLIYASGRPYTDLSRLGQLEDRRNLSAADRISYLPSYQRIDLGVAYNFPIRETRAVAGLSVFNLTNRNNVKYLQYIYSVSATGENTPALPSSTVIGTETNLLDRTLNLFLNWQF